MPMLPTAHASLKFGHKQLDFYAAPGQVVGSDPRARADERRIQDIEGARHVVRLDPEQKMELGAGDQVAVLRLQPGPAKRSRPVAVAHYDQQKWARTQPATAAILSRAGVARNVNWALSMFALFATALLFVWPSLHGLASEFLPRGTMNGIPAFDIFAFALSAMPELATFGQSLASIPFLERLTTLVPQLAGQEMAIVASAIWLFGTLVCFSARSWRLLWIPSFIALIGLGGIALGGVEAPQIPALIGLGGTALFFAIGGLINRVRDGMRLEARIARLSDHLLQHPVEELVQRPVDPVAPVAPQSAPEEGAPETTHDDDDLPSVEDTFKHTDEGRVAARVEDPDNARAITLPPPPPMAALNSDDDQDHDAIEAHEDTHAEAPSESGEADEAAAHRVSAVEAETLEGESHEEAHLSVEGEDEALIATAQEEQGDQGDGAEPVEDATEDTPVVAAGALTQDAEDEITLAVIEIEDTPRLHADDEASEADITASDEIETKANTDEAPKAVEAHALEAHEDEAPALTPISATPHETQLSSDEESAEDPISVDAIKAQAPDIAEDAQEDHGDTLTDAQEEDAHLSEGDEAEDPVIAAEADVSAAEHDEDDTQIEGDAPHPASIAPALESAEAEEVPQLLHEETESEDTLLTAEEASSEDEVGEDDTEAQPVKVQNADSLSHDDDGETAHKAELSHDDETHDAIALSQEPFEEADDADVSTDEGDDLPPKAVNQGEVEAHAELDANLEGEDAREPALQTEAPKKVRRGFPANVIPFLRPSVAKPPMPKAPKS